MSTRMHSYPSPASSEKEKHLKKKETQQQYLKLINPKHFKYPLFLFAFLCIWLLLLFFCFPQPSKTLSPPKTYNHTKWTPQSSPLPTCDGGASVYVYELPPKFNRGLLRHCRHLNVYTDMCPHVTNAGLGQPLSTSAWFATHQFIAEMIFHARLENHPCRTRDPRRASLFYVPFYGGLHASSKFRESDLAARDALAVELAEYLRRQDWWRRRHGKDHFLVLGRTAWDFMRSPGGPDFGANNLLMLPPVRNISVLTVERHPWRGSNQHGIPYPSYFHPSTWEEMSTWQDRVRRADRIHLFSFVGAPRVGVEKAAIRDEIMRQCAESIRCELVKCGKGASKCYEPEEVVKVMMRSEFCLQAPGDSFTRRSTFDSVLAGCIPVFFSPHTAYSQYAWFLPSDGSEYSVYIDGTGNGRRIEEELRLIPAERVERMRRRVVDLIPRVTYAHPNATRSGFLDAVDVGLAALSNHVQFS
ncbi:probable xyloglucan galactosyltransferase GT17 [Malania oleifera]|uniref:probable xyloglucan galactosyltransferase GT17 n=1 Tax=Malania oleifera TaxID=397392 RepID=UPI0025AE7086|nr:probable xyloglucan galactosyltransferase GT17 [Malania oleifera]